MRVSIIPSNIRVSVASGMLGTCAPGNGLPSSSRTRRRSSFSLDGTATMAGSVYVCAEDVSSSPAGLVCRRIQRATRCVDALRARIVFSVIWILLVLLTVIGGAAAIGIVAGARRQSLARGAPAALAGAREDTPE